MYSVSSSSSSPVYVAVGSTVARHLIYPHEAQQQRNQRRSYVLSEASDRPGAAVGWQPGRTGSELLCALHSQCALTSNLSNGVR